MNSDGLTPKEWLAKGDWLAVNDVNIFTLAIGEGIPVLVLHAFPTSSYDFSRIVPLLDREFRFILFDYPGFGFSSKPVNYSYSLMRYADIAQAIMAHHTLDSVHILAHDIGDSVALEMLRRGQSNVDRMVLLNGSVYSIPFVDIRMRVMQKALLDPVVGSLISRLRLVKRWMLAAFFNRIFFQPLTRAEIDAFWELVNFNDGVKNFHHLMHYMVERWKHQFELLDALRSHQTSLTLIWGLEDPVATPEVADKILEYRPDAFDIRLPDVGHYPHWEVPDLVAHQIRDALG